MSPYITPANLENISYNLVLFKGPLTVQYRCDIKLLLRDKNSCKNLIYNSNLNDGL